MGKSKARRCALPMHDLTVAANASIARQQLFESCVPDEHSSPYLVLEDRRQHV